MKHRLLLTFALVMGVADVASAQILPPIGRPRQPMAWTSVSIGWLNQQGLCDPDSGACWNFGSAPQWRASLEFPIGTGATVGAVGTTARVPLIYASTVVGTNSCVSCDADANVSQIMGLLHLGGGSGFQQVIDIQAGVTMFSNFRTLSGTKLGTGKTAQDFSFGLGYGFGYFFSPHTQVTISQDYGLIIHKRQPGSQNNTAQQSTIRLGIRLGLGG